MERAWRFGHCRMRLFRGDIAGLAVEAVVNPANGRLWMGSGVAGSLKRAGGPSIEEEAVACGPIEPGEAVVTGGGSLPDRYVIHAVTIRPDRTTDGEAIARATRNALRRCAELGLYSVAFPAMGTGVGGFPPAEAARLMFDALIHHLARHRLPGEVTFALYDQEAFGAFAAECARRSGGRGAEERGQGAEERGGRRTPCTPD